MSTPPSGPRCFRIAVTMFFDFVVLRSASRKMTRASCSIVRPLFEARSVSRFATSSSSPLIVRLIITKSYE